MNLFVNFVLVLLIGGIRAEYLPKQVQVVYRHGDRSPTQLYPTSRNKAYDWRYGLGQLTEQGIRQHYQLGVWLRDRYSSIVGTQLNISEIFVRSSDLDRTLMSAESNLAGFVRNDSYHIIKGLQWHPIPVHTVREKTDHLLELYSCARYELRRATLFKLDYFQKKFAPYSSRLEYLREKSGLKNLTFMDSWIIYDQLYCEKVHNMTWDDWVTPDVWRDLMAINKVNWELLFYKDLAKLAGGLLLYTLTDNMKQFSTNGMVGGHRSKIIMYSGHDTDVAPLAKLLGFYNNLQPPYASCIIFELHANEDNHWAVKVLYKNDSESSGPGDFHPHVVSGCSDLLCPLSEFVKTTAHKAMSKEEYKKVCTIEINVLLIVQIVVFTTCIVLFLVSFAIFIVRFKRKRPIKYLPVDSKKSVN